MGANSSRVSQLYDASTAVVLRTTAAVALTTTTTLTAISLSELRAAYWQNYEIPHGKFVVAFNVVAVKSSDSDETYVMTIKVDDTSGMSDSPVTIDTFTIPRAMAAGFITRVLDSRDIPNLDSDHSGTGKWITVTATLGGTNPSLQFACWLAKCLGE